MLVYSTEGEKLGILREYPRKREHVAGEWDLEGWPRMVESLGSRWFQ